LTFFRSRAELTVTSTSYLDPILAPLLAAGGQDERWKLCGWC
jgi:hypothetical protein